MVKYTLAQKQAPNTQTYNFIQWSSDNRREWTSFGKQEDVHDVDRSTIIMMLNMNNMLFLSSYNGIITQDEIKNSQKFHTLEESFLRHHGSKHDVSWTFFKEMANVISKWSFRDCFVQVNTIGKSIKFSVVLESNIKVNATRYFEDEEEMVFYSIFLNKELLVAESSSLQKLSKKIMQIDKKDN